MLNDGWRHLDHVYQWAFSTIFEICFGSKKAKNNTQRVILGYQLELLSHKMLKFNLSPPVRLLLREYN